MITSLPRVVVAVRDMERAVTLFRDRFAMPVHELEWASRELGGRLALCLPPGGSRIELVSPSDSARPHSQAFVKFLERRGEGPFALILHAEDPDAEAEELERRGLPCLPRMAEAHGRDIHPRDTCGVLIRIYPEVSVLNDRVENEIAKLGLVSSPGVQVGLSGVRRVLVAVNDLDAAVRVYRDQLGLETEIASDERSSDVRRAIVTPPAGAKIELLAPLGAEDGRIASFLRDHGQGMYALVLESDDVEGTLRELPGRKVPFGAAEAAWEIEPAFACGVRLRLHGRRLLS